MLLSLPESTERAGLELTLQVALGAVLEVTRGWSAAETAEANSRARTLADHHAGAQSVPVLAQLFNTSLTRGEIRAALAFADQMLAIACGTTDRAILTSNLAEALARLLLGDLIDARRHFLRAIERYREEDFRDAPDDYGLTLIYFQESTNGFWASPTVPCAIRTKVAHFPAA